MARLVLVRHGQAAARWGDHLDPGLTELGREQADAAAGAVDTLFDRPVPILTSPLLRCRETAAPLAARWSVEPVVEPLVGEIESPEPGLEARSAWLDGFLHERWANADGGSIAWRGRVLDRLLTVDQDVVVFTHFVALNVALGAATGDDRVVCRHVDYCTPTVFQNDGGRLALVDAPAERDTEVL